jgi:hypothetical protein
MQGTQELSEKVNKNDIIVLGQQLEILLRKVDRDFRSYGDNYRGIYWQKMVALMIHNLDLVEEFIGQSLPEEKEDGEYLFAAERIAAKGRNFKKRAHDELLATMIVVAFDEEKSDIGMALSMDEAIKFFKKHGYSIKKYDSLAMFLDLANEKPGVYIIQHDNVEQRIIVADAINENSVEVYVSEDIDELNKQLSTFFKTLSEAWTTINNREGRFATMSALLV